MNDMPIARTIVPITSPATVGQHGDEADTDRGEHQGDRSRSTPTDAVRDAGAEDADTEDQHAVEEEDRSGSDPEVVLGVQGHERAEAGQRDQPQEQDRAGQQRRSVDELRPLVRFAFHLPCASPSNATMSASPADTSHASV